MRNGRDDDFISDCKALESLLQLEEPPEGEIHHRAASMYNYLWINKPVVSQHVLEYRYMMLLANASAHVYWSSRVTLSSSLKQNGSDERASVLVAQAIAKLLSKQENDGSWLSEDDSQSTVNALDALDSISNLPYVETMKQHLQRAIDRGREVLSLMPTESDLGFCYDRALRGSLGNTTRSKTPKSNQVSDRQTQKISGFTSFFSSCDHLHKEPLWKIKISIVEALLYRPALQAARKEVFPATSAKEKDKYLDYIPIMWVFANNLGEGSVCRATPEYLLDMMVLSMYVFLVDEYMESTVVQFSAEGFAAFKRGVENMDYRVKQPGSQFNGSTNHLELDDTNDRVATAINIFNAFSTYIQSYPRIMSASANDLLELRSETRNYLLYHIHQLEDNTRLAQQSSSNQEIIKFLTPRTSYQTWVHTVGAGHVSGPWAFAFFCCIMSSTIRSGRDCFSTVKQKLVAHKMNSHIGAFCRIYNDYGSIARDREERNLNSVNFPEFFDPSDGESRTEKVKERLLEAAQYERQCALEAADKLYSDLEGQGEEGRRITECLRVYMGACEQFSDMAMTRDITNSVK
ncbi:MAG: hypothetical protein Q9166_004017 [cf. Caloplaca sp. 2 TL-2023]